MNVVFPTIVRVISPTIGNPFSLPAYGGVLLPPSSASLLAWIKGPITDDTDRIDYYKVPGDFPMEMSQGACLDFNGVDDYGTLDTAITLVGDFELSFGLDATGGQVNDFLYVVSSAGALDAILLDVPSDRIIIKLNTINYYFNNIPISSNILIISRSGSDITIKNEHTQETVTCSDSQVSISSIGTRDGVSSIAFQGKLYNLRLKDSTQDIHFPLAETSPTADTCFSTDGQHTIALTSGNLTALRSGRQDEYFYNVIQGWYEISGDDTKYPYPVAAYTKHHPGNIWNQSEQLHAFKQFTVLTLNGSTDEILLPFDVPADATMSYTGTGTAVLDTANNKIVDTSAVIGTIYRIEILDAVGDTLAWYECNEGSGAALADTSGNGYDATLVGVEVDLWASKVTPQAIIDADGGRGVFVDPVTNNPIPVHQDILDGLVTLDVATCSVSDPDPIDYLKLRTVDGSDWYMDGQWYPSDVYQSHSASTDFKIGVKEGTEIVNAYLWNNWGVTDFAFDIAQTGWALTGTVYFHNTGVTGDIAQTGWVLTGNAHFFGTSVTGDITQTGWLLTGTASFSGTGVTGDVSQTGWLLTGNAYFNSTVVVGDITQTGWLLTGNAYFYSTGVTGDVSQTGWLLTGNAYFNSTNVTCDTSTRLFGPDCTVIYLYDCNLTSTMVDNALVAVDNDGGVNGLLKLAGTNAAPTSVGLAAKTNLEAKGWTVEVTI